MKKAFCTFAVGPYQDCLEISRNSFQKYSAKYGYDYVEYYPTAAQKSGKPPSWGKVILMMELLLSYDVVMWLDCDTLILNYSEDVLSYLPYWAIQAITEHRYDGAEIASTGLWIAKPDLLPYLEQMWKMEEYTDHIWWEQAALQELLGYGQDDRYLNPHPFHVIKTNLFNHTYFLDVSWNSIDYQSMNSDARIMHFPAMDVGERVSRMREWVGSYNYGRQVEV